MRKTLTALVIAASLPVLAMAQTSNERSQTPCHGKDQHSQYERPRGMHAGFKTMKLSAEQRQQVAENLKQLPKPHEIQQKYLDKLPQADKDALVKELIDARSARTEALRQVLTPEQQKAFDERKAAFEKRKAERQEFEAWKAEKAKQA